MKQSLKIFLILGVLFALLYSGIRVGAAGEIEYTLEEDGGEYILSAYSDGSLAPIMRSGKISEIFDYLNSYKESEKRIVFGDVSVYENIDFGGGAYSLTGKITVHGSVINIHSGSVEIDDAKINLESGSYIRIKGGKLQMNLGRINAPSASAVVMDYSASAVFIMQGGEIIADAEDAALRLDYGSAYISGGKISNKSSFAAEIKSSLTLTDAPSLIGEAYDIKTTLPITLGRDNKKFLGNISVKYEAEFEKGSITPVFYSADERALSGIRFYDINEELCDIKFISEHSGAIEKNFGGVYLPYYVSFYHEGALLKREEILSGMRCESFIPGEVEGYLFSGWSTERRGGSLFDFAKEINEDIVLYSRYSLKAPEFTLKSFSSYYTGDTYNVGFESVSHPLIDSAFLSYEWYKDGVKISNSKSSVALTAVSDSGSYKCKLIFSYGSDTVEVMTPEVVFSIKKAIIEAPEIAPKIYTGGVLFPDIYSTYLYSVSEVSGIKVGSYPVKLSATDMENYEFEGGKSEIFIDFNILRAENYWTERISVSSIYEGNSPMPKASSRFGDAEYLYSSSKDGVYTSDVPYSVGVYYCICRVRENENYTALESEAIEFSIYEEIAIGLSLYTMPTVAEYKAFDLFSSFGLSLMATYNSGRTEIIEKENLSISYQTSITLRYGDNAVIASYDGLFVLVPITVLPAEYNLSGLSFSDIEAFYSGEYQSIAFSGALPIGEDGIPLEAFIVGGGTDAGEYKITLNFKSESRDYRIPEPMVARLLIKPFESVVTFSKTDFVYDGNLKCPEAYYTDIDGRKRFLKVNGARSLAGEYEATAVCDDENYKLLSPRVSYRILKADYDFSNIVWSGDEFIYDREEKRVSVSGLPSGVSVIGYSDNAGIDAGEYTAYVSLSYDTLNYNAPPVISHNWRIKKADYALDGFRFLDNVAVYDGEMHYPILVGEMPIGLDGIALEYSFGAGASSVREGIVSVNISFATKSNNYNVPEDISANVEITPFGIAVIWGSAEFVYNMHSQAPIASASECEIRVLGAVSGAGSYIATAITVDSNYYVINATKEFTIAKAENLWTSRLEIENIFEGNKPSPRAECIAGNVEYRYTDKDGNELSEPPTESGEYYVYAIALGNENYNEKNSEKLRFEIIKIIPIGIDAHLIRKEFSAFQTLRDEDITVKVFYNDGSERILSLSEAAVAYQSADSFRFSDGSFKLSYMGFEKIIDISVIKAEYDMTKVRWENLYHVYDGNEKRAELSGLPEGVAVESYIGGVGTFCGEYSASAVLIYDSENYIEPKLPEGVLVIEKAVVMLPLIENLIYNGKGQLPKIEESALYEIIAEENRDAGLYSLELRLTDSKNYKFESGEGAAYLEYEILPMQITLKLADVHKYAFSPYEIPEYEIVNGEVISGDTLDLRFDFGKAGVSCVSENPNYIISILGGKIIKHNALSNNSVLALFIILIILIAVILLVYIIIKKRGAIYNYLMMIRCRMRSYEKLKNSDTEVKVNEEYEMKKPAEVLDASMSVDRERADSLISDSLAKELVRREYVKVYTEGNKKGIINIDTINENFTPGERVDVNKLKEMSLIPYDTAYIKVLARGLIDKPLKVYANDFSLSAVKMIALTGGEAIRCISIKKTSDENKK